MPKLIQSYEAAECKSIRKISDTPYEIWSWREECIGLRGILFIFLSSRARKSILESTLSAL